MGRDITRGSPQAKGNLALVVYRLREVTHVVDRQRDVGFASQNDTDFSRKIKNILISSLAMYKKILDFGHLLPLTKVTFW
jgi:hypothetical protein